MNTESKSTFQVLKSLSWVLVKMKEGQYGCRPEAKYWQTPPCSWQIWLDASCDEYQTRWYHFSHLFHGHFSLQEFGLNIICLFLLIICLCCLIGFLRQKDLLWINIAWVVTWYYIQQAATWRINQFGWDMGVNYPPH